MAAVWIFHFSIRLQDLHLIRTCQLASSQLALYAKKLGFSLWPVPFSSFLTPYRSIHVPQRFISSPFPIRTGSQSVRMRDRVTNHRAALNSSHRGWYLCYQERKRVGIGQIFFYSSFAFLQFSSSTKFTRSFNSFASKLIRSLPEYWYFTRTK